MANIPVVQHHPGRHELAHRLLLANPGDLQFIRVGQMELNSFDGDFHVQCVYSTLRYTKRATPAATGGMERISPSGRHRRMR